MSQVYHFQNFYVTRLREAVDASSTTIYVDNPPTISSGILVLEGKNVSKREIIYFSSVSGYALNDCVRGLEGTIPNTHNQGATIEQAVTAGQLDQVLSPHILLQGLGNDENAAMSQDAVTRVFTEAHNTDGTLKNNSVSTAKIGDNQVTTAKVADGSVTADKIDFTTFTPIYENIVTSSGKTYTITQKGIYMAWGVSSNTTGEVTATITMAETIRCKAAAVASGSWESATAVAVGALNAGQTIVVAQTGASTSDNRSSIGMCLIQRTN